MIEIAVASATGSRNAVALSGIAVEGLAPSPLLGQGPPPVHRKDLGARLAPEGGVASPPDIDINHIADTALVNAVIRRIQHMQLSLVIAISLLIPRRNVRIRKEEMARL